MPVTIDGSPTHVLVVHIVVVLLPLAVLGSLLLVAVPATRRPFSLLTLVVGFIACIAIPFAFLSGSALRDRVPDSPLVRRHVSLAHQLLPIAAVFGLALAAFVVVDLLRRTRGSSLNALEQKIVAATPRLRRYSRSTKLTTIHRVAATALVLLAVVTGVQVYRVGAAGAKASWSGRLSSGQGLHR
jgi:amino acid transporter